MQEEMQEKILRNIAKNGKLSTEDLAAMLAASPEEIEKESLYLMSGSGFDLTVIIVGKTMKEVAWFVATKLAPMESVMSTATHFVLKKYKEHGLSLVAEERGDERQLITP